MSFARIGNIHTGEWEDVKLGISWTNFFFGSWVPLYRGEISQTFIYIFFQLVTFNIYQFIMVFTFNKGYIQRKLQKGWLPLTKHDRDILLTYEVLAPNSIEELGEEDKIINHFKANRMWFGIFLILNGISLFIISEILYQNSF